MGVTSMTGNSMGRAFHSATRDSCAIDFCACVIALVALLLTASESTGDERAPCIFAEIRSGRRNEGGRAQLLA